MNSMVIYGSRHGNTRKIAEVVAAELGRRGPVQLVSDDKAPSVIPDETDLVVIGGPTEAHGTSQAVAGFLDRVRKGSFTGKYAAAFDTRLRWPKWLSGSASAGIDERLHNSGAEVIGPGVSFFVGGRLPVLEPGELERAAQWAGSLGARVEAKILVAAVR
jgi:flavodoxin